MSLDQLVSVKVPTLLTGIQLSTLLALTGFQPTGEISCDQAIKAASKHQTGFPVLAQRVETPGLRSWSVVYLTSGRKLREVVIGSEDGDLLELKSIRYSKEFTDFRPRRTRISATKAMQLAMSYRNGTVIEVELEREEGRVQWEITVQSASKTEELEFDARTGDFIEID